LDTFRHFTVTASLNDGRVAPAVLSALEDDLNTPQVIAELHKLLDEARTGDRQASCDLKVTCAFLGFELDNVSLQKILSRQRGGIDETKVEALIANRATARAQKNFKESDRIRDELAKMGVILQDSKDGTTWEIAR
jgi:cysteinyl-tRNA synthetase